MTRPDWRWNLRAYGLWFSITLAICLALAASGR